MEFSKKITCAAAKEIDLVAYLSNLGIEPSRIRQDNYWYLSPLRNENTPSFKVNRKINRWYDFGEGIGGSIIDFAIRYHHCTIAEFLASLNGGPSFSSSTKNYPQSEKPLPLISILHVKPLFASSLLSYLAERRITITIATRFCHQVHYRLYQRNYYAIGFRNDSGGYELRNPYCKNSSSPKDITSIKSGKDIVTVFEGFIDFLSYLVLFGSNASEASDYLVLNSLSLFERARPVMDAYQKVLLLLDNDEPGNRFTLYGCSLSKGYKDGREFYNGYKDINDYLCHFGLTPKSPPT